MLRQIVRRFLNRNNDKTINLWIAKIVADPSVEEGEAKLYMSQEDYKEYEALVESTKNDFEMHDSLIKTRDGYQQFKEFIAEKDLELSRLEREVEAAKEQVTNLMNSRK